MMCAHIQTQAHTHTRGIHTAHLHSASMAPGEPSRQDFTIDLDQRERGAGKTVHFQR